MSKFEEVSIASRSFSLAALFGLSFIVEGPLAVRVVLIVAVIAAMATYLSLATNLSPVWSLTGEMLLVGLVIGLTLPESLILLPYLVVLSMLAGIFGRWKGAAFVLGAQVVATIVVPIASTGFTEFSDDSRLLAPWLSTSLAMGLLGGATSSIVRSSGGNQPDDASYLSARRLLTQLHVVTRRLSGGLDAGQISMQVLTDLTAHRDIAEAALFGRSDSGVFVLLAQTAREHGPSSTFGIADTQLRAAWSTMEPAHYTEARTDGHRQHRVAFPLRIGPRVVAVAVCTVPAAPSPAQMEELRCQLDDHAVRLDTALLFEQIRMGATIDERQRLAREIHDGVAQEVASLGYIVDELVGEAENPVQAERLASLRVELSRTVTELRYSIFDLRFADGGAGLGMALSDYLSGAETRSAMRVHYSLDEGPERLPPAVESELLRIAQEAITNARKHSGAENLWVDCWIRAPAARIEIRDDGAGLGTPRGDSYGLSIMRERADRIGAEVTVAPGRDPLPGTSVTVEIGSEHSGIRAALRSDRA